MRIGLVGYGAWGRVHAGVIASIPQLTLASVVAGDDESARAAAELPGVTVHRDYDALLSDPTIDLIDIVSPNHLHAAMTIVALGAGKHVLLEKPMATTLSDARRVVEAAEHSDRYVGVGLQLHTSRQWGRIRDLINEGTIGKPRYANSLLFRRPFRGGAADWRFTGEQVGSWILEEAVHYIDLLLLYFQGSGLPTELSADGHLSVRGAGMHDSFTCTLRFADGAYASFSQCLGGFEHSLVTEIAGTEGAIRTSWSGAADREPNASFQLKLRRAGSTDAEIVPIEKSGEVYELEEQMRRLVTDVPCRTPLVSARAALPSQVICLEIERAIAERRTIKLDWATASS